MEVLQFPGQTPTPTECYKMMHSYAGIDGSRITKLVPLLLQEADKSHAISMIEREYDGSGKFAFLLHKEKAPDPIRPDVVTKELVDGTMFTGTIEGVYFNETASPEWLAHLCGLIAHSIPDLELEGRAA